MPKVKGSKPQASFYFRDFDFVNNLLCDEINSRDRSFKFGRGEGVRMVNGQFQLIAIDLRNLDFWNFRREVNVLGGHVVTCGEIHAPVKLRVLSESTS